MIIYLAVTALVNIALGYALAMYLGPISRNKAATAVTEDHADHDYHAPIESYEEPPAEEPVRVDAPIAAAAPPAAPAPPATPAAAPVAAAAAPEVEENLLAGINEFRNQLAQMKDVAEVEVPATPEPALAATAAGAPAAKP